jgi:tetratricopeptide (TPR) repeat protein
LIDLRVEDHKDPVKELDRLLRSFRAYEHMDQGDEYMAKGMMSEALGEYQKAQTMLPKNLEMKYWHAITLANNKEIEAAIDILRRVYKEDKNWKILTNRLPEAGLLNLDQWDLERILNVK